MISGHVVCVILEGDILPTALAGSGRSDCGVRREVRLREKIRYHLTFLGNCPPTPPLSHHFALSLKQVLMLA